MSYIQDVISGNANIDEIDDYIDDWHNLADTDIINIWEYLGMNEKEYDSFIRDESNLSTIIEKYKS